MKQNRRSTCSDEQHVIQSTDYKYFNNYELYTNVAYDPLP